MQTAQENVQKIRQSASDLATHLFEIKEGKPVEPASIERIIGQLESALTGIKMSIKEITHVV